MSELDLFGNLLDHSGAVVVDDYREDWEPSQWSCWNCEHIARPMGGFKQGDRCTLLGREVCRVSGICSSFCKMKE